MYMHAEIIIFKAVVLQTNKFVNFIFCYAVLLLYELEKPKGSSWVDTFFT